MNPPYGGPANPGSYMPPYQPPHSNSYAFPGVAKAPYGGGGLSNSQNGPVSSNCHLPNQSTSQVQSASSVPPNSQLVNNQLSQDMNAIRLSQNQNHPLLTTHPLPTSNPSIPGRPPPPHPQGSQQFQQQYYWQQQQSQRMPAQNTGAATYSHPPTSFAPNMSSTDMYSAPHNAAYGDRMDSSHSPHSKMPLPQDSYQQDPYQPPHPTSRSSPYTNGTGGFMPSTGQYGGHHPNSNMNARYPPSSLSPGMQGQSNVPTSAGQFNNQMSNAGAAPQQQNRMGCLQQPPPQQQSRRLDPDNMPSPIQVIEDDRKLRSCVFSTAQRGSVPPLVTTNFTVVDEGLCSPRFMRSTVYNVPTTAEMLKQTSVPFALAISPFARLHEGEMHHRSLH